MLVSSHGKSPTFDDLTGGPSLIKIIEGDPGTPRARGMVAGEDHP